MAVLAVTLGGRGFLGSSRYPSTVSTASIPLGHIDTFQGFQEPHKHIVKRCNATDSTPMDNNHGYWSCVGIMLEWQY